MPFPLRRFLRALALATALASIFTAASSADAQKPIRVDATPGTTASLDTLISPCVKVTQPPSIGEAKLEPLPANAGAYVLTFTSTPQQRDQVTIGVQAGTHESADKKTCEPAAAAINKQYVVTFGTSPPSVSDEVLAKAFRVLIGAFVVALLLESAFALLFNWRVFIAYASGKAWRTPIMFLGALVVVRAFDLDLMSTLFTAYHSQPGEPPVAGNWFTSVLTAMILAGGSVGVNRLLVALGFRSQSRDEDLLPVLDMAEAWVAVKVEHRPGSPALKAEVQITEAEPPQGQTVPVTHGVVGGRKTSLKDFFFRDANRVPPLGGIKVSTTKYYRITVYDLKTGKMYDVSGSPINDVTEAKMRRFGPRAIIDLWVTI